MRYEILGPLRVIDEYGPSSISAPKMETLLAVLLIRSGQVVPLDRLITEIWGEQTPQRAIASLYVYVSRLRTFLEFDGRRSGSIITRSPGYMLRLDDSELDFNAFQGLVTAGRTYARESRHQDAAATLTEALSLWRGPVLQGIPDGPMVRGFKTRAAELRLECVELLINSRLELGQHRESVGYLHELTAEYPLRETFHWQLMTALHRSGQRDDALNVYESARRLLNDELGLEPGPALQSLQRSILQSEVQLALTHRADFTVSALRLASISSSEKYAENIIKQVR